MPEQGPAFRLESFIIEGLFSRCNVELPLQENRLILVGENGSGKSTILNILYLFLTAQWVRLAKLPFRTVRAKFNGESYAVHRTEISEIYKGGQMQFFDDYLMHRRRLPPDTRNALLFELQQRPANYWITNLDDLARVAHSHGLETDDLHELLYFQSRFQRDADKSRARNVNTIEASIRRNLPSQVLFLPTYRRIERDLKSIFPNIRLENGLQDFHKASASRAGCIELVEFGMKDVEATFAKTIQSLGDSLRSDLDNMTGAYLRDVIRKEYKKPDVAALIAPGAADSVNDVIDKIDAKFLSQEDRFQLKTLMQSLQDAQDFAEDEQVTVHYLTKLAEVRRNQQRREEKVRSFVSLCNEYLQDKMFTFDSSKAEIGLWYVPDALRSKTDATKSAEGLFTKLPPEWLSSGEKQIVSLFAHIFLSGEPSYFVIIDEPELSISVPWQQRFLHDLIETKLCTGLVAVTHSPFIFENDLVDFAYPVSSVSKPYVLPTPPPQLTNKQVPRKKKGKGKR